MIVELPGVQDKSSKLPGIENISTHALLRGPDEFVLRRKQKSGCKNFLALPH